MITESRLSRTMQWLIAIRMPIILLALVIAVTFMTDGKFAQLDNLVNVMRQVSFEAMIAFGMTLVIVTGGIDLSVGSLVALTGVVAAVVMRSTLDWSPVASIMVGLLCGVTTGADILRLIDLVKRRHSKSIRSRSNPEFSLSRARILPALTSPGATPF